MSNIISILLIIAGPILIFGAGSFYNNQLAILIIGILVFFLGIILYLKKRKEANTISTSAISSKIVVGTSSFLFFGTIFGLIVFIITFMIALGGVPKHLLLLPFIILTILAFTMYKLFASKKSP